MGCQVSGDNLAPEPCVTWDSIFFLCFLSLQCDHITLLRLPLLKITCHERAELVTFRGHLALPLYQGGSAEL